MSPLADKIIRTNFTKQQALAELTDLRLAAQEHFFGRGELTKDQRDLVGDISKDHIDAFFSQAEKELEKAEDLVVYTAVELPDTEVAKVGKKARALFEPDLLLDFKVDSALIGGAALAWKGQYKDYSIRAKLADKKAEIQKIYEQY